MNAHSSLCLSREATAAAKPSLYPYLSRPWASARIASSPLCSIIIRVLFLAFLAVSPVSAVRVPFHNCLAESYRTNNPTPLQWVPLHAEAVFSHERDTHNLLITIWGNVTGQQNRGELPPSSDPYWQNNDEINGKIVQTANPNEVNNRATTLFRRVNVLTYQPFRQAVDFCVRGLENGECPLGPVFNTSELRIPDGLPAINMSADFSSNYAFTSFSSQFLIIYGDRSRTRIGCITATITPDMGGLVWLLRFLPLLVLIFTGVSVAMAGIFSPWGTTNIFHWTSNYGRDADLLRLVTPGFGDCLQYIQFIVLSGSLSLNYPGFFQPIVSQVGWSALMFNQSIVSNTHSQTVVDGMYITEGSYGLQRVAQLIGMGEPEDIWAGMMVWLCVIIASVFVLIQAGFFLQWLYRMIDRTPEEDLRAKNIPFVVGNVVRIVFNYFLLPIVAFSCFQLVVADGSPTFAVGLAATTIVVLLAFAVWLLYFIITTRPKAALFDDLATVLRYGPLYNTYSDEAAAFALIPILLNLIRGIGIGAVQPSGIAQVVILAICEVIHILTLNAFRPFHSPTSMNAYHTVYSALRLICIMLMVAFSPTLDVDESTKGWVGYVILLLHGIVLGFGFVINALQTIVEVVARMLGAGGDDVRGLTRGGLSKIFGMRQLSRRATPRPGPSRASQLSTSAMLDAEDGSKMGYSMPGGRLRSESGASLSGMAAFNRHRSSSALDSIDVYTATHRHMDSGSSYMPGTPGEASTFSFLPSPSAAHYANSVTPMETADPYYRPPRRRRETLTDSAKPEKQRTPLAMEVKRLSQTDGPATDNVAADAEINRGTTPAPGAAISFPANRPDYSTREVDFYYGVRGPALNSEGLGRKLGTGPADPTGPIATASGWFRHFWGGKTKEKGKGFEVVRSARMPPGMMARNGAFGDETPPEGIPVAMGVIRSGPIESDDEDDGPRVRQSAKPRGKLLTEEGDPQESEPDEPDSPEAKRLPLRTGTVKSNKPAAATVQLRRIMDDGFDLPEIPRKSSKRHSALASHSPSPSRKPADQAGPSEEASRGHRQDLGISRLPFEDSGSLKHSESMSTLGYTDDFSQIDLSEGRGERPISFGTVPHHGISRVEVQDRNVDLLGSSAELVDVSLAPKRSLR
ncbi:hypothetical protein B0I35DRAFT_347345 [Stachybotrys elegans]|uniref:ML-like domain-containing protein n=1 Tax=Stachybotrys elegans TaxID=80388 RepID=A0A8K0T014_9HYPO|nr:hypothetical protein B0I35DRAFT_347345 [Stachybotrys elegans]